MEWVSSIIDEESHFQKARCIGEPPHLADLAAQYFRRSEQIMFPKNSFLAVVGADDDFWLCRVVRKVDKSPRLAKVGEGGGFDVNWLEQVSEEENENIYNASTTANAVELKSVVTRVYLKRRKDGRDVEYSLDFWNLSYFNRLKVFESIFRYHLKYS